MIMKTKTMNKIKLLAVLGGLWAVGCGLVWADLTAVVTPGYQFPLDGSVTPTYDLLNLLAQPTITIYGTVGGSNTLAVGSVTGVSLSDTLPDGTTIGWNGNTPRQLEVTAAGLVTGQDGLVAVTNMFKLSYDPNYFQLSTNSWPNTNSNTGNGLVLWLTPIPGAFSNAVTLPANALGWGATNVAGSNVPMSGLLLGPEFTVKPVTNATQSATNTGPGLATRYFTSTEVTMPTLPGLTLYQAHNLGYQPTRVRGVLVCKTAELNYMPGDELELAEVSLISSTFWTAFTCGASVTNVWAVRSDIEGGAKAYVPDRNSGIVTAITPGNWRLKMYAW